MRRSPQYLSNAPLRVVLLLRQLSIGGAERQAVMLARELARRGHEIIVTTFYDGGGLEVELAQAGVAHHCLGKSGRGDVIGFGRRLERFLKQERPDVLYTLLPVPNLLSLFARGSRRPAIVWGVRASNMQMRQYDWLSRLTHALEPRFSFHADLIIANAQSAAIAAVDRGFPRVKLRVVHNGVDAARFAFDKEKRACARRNWGIGEDAVIVGHIARYDPMKDHANFIAAFSQAATQRDDLRAVCVTSGAESQRALRAEIAELDLGHRIIVADAGADAAEVMSGFDLLCSSSAYGEGFSNVLCEALACGRSCVATDVGDARLILGGAGFLVPPQDAPALASALLSAAAERAKDREGSAKRALAAVRRWTPEAMAQATEGLMREALALRR